MTALCPIHNEYLEEKQSKTKFEDDGTPKTYWGHMADGKMCFGRAEKPSNGGGYQAARATADSLAHRAPAPQTPYGEQLEASKLKDSERSRRIERQHSQEMALRYLDICQQRDSEFVLDTSTVKELTDLFEADLNKP